MNTSVLTAVFKRNFFSYFANPTGYVFICVFVFLSAIAAFWPDDFFNANLANLDQLNKFFSFIMLFFVPAITMSIWADETRQGTDELLLTIPATDFDIVLGKYFAAVAIYTVALLISLVSNFVVLSQLGNPDVGMYLCTHFGYWLLGLAMLAIGMVASFMTRNLTVAYILGALFNAPLVLMARVDIIPVMSHRLAAAVRQWSLGGQCQEFGRGILGLSGIVYFLSITAIMLYLCMVLIGRRNWARGDDSTAQSGHFLVRILALAAIAVAAVFFVQNHNLRSDVTSEQLSSLSPYTMKLVKELNADYVEAGKLQPQIAKLEEVVKKQEDSQKKKEAEKKSGDGKPIEAKADDAKAAVKSEEKKADEKKPEIKAADAPAVSLSEEAKKLASLRETFDKLKVQGPVRIDAFISAEVPELYVQTRLNLLTVLREFKVMGGDMVELEINEMTRADPLAEVAKTRFKIVPKEVMDNHGGTYKRDHIFLGVAFTCGLEKVVLPFVERGLPAEYELVRSLCTVTRQKRKRIGVLETDAHVFGNFSQMGMSPSWQLIQELQKQYEVVQVSPADLGSPRKPGETEKRYDVLLAIQPSAMGPKEMDSFIAAVRAGQPTVIFEDPFFLMMQGIPGTYQPRMQQQQNPMMGFGRENQEKGDIRALWRLLGIDFSNGGDGDEFNPMAGRQPSRGTEKVVWQRYNPFPKYGDLPPELVFIDHGYGAKEPFCESDPISSKLQNLFFPGPGLIENTPEVVKRLIAKWHNRQYAKQLEQELRKLTGEFDNAEAQGNNEKIAELASRGAKVQEEYSRVSSGGEGEKTIQPDQINDDRPLNSLLKGQAVVPGAYALSELRRDLQNRFPIRASGEGNSEEESARLANEGPASLQAEAKLNEALSQAATVADAIKYAEGVMALQIKDRTFVPLVQTGSEAAGTIPVGRISQPFEDPEGHREELSPFRSLFYLPSNNQQYVLAAHIQGKPRGAKGASAPMNVVLVADVEMVSDVFFRWREQGSVPGQDINFDFDNVTFVLNALDSLVGDDRFLELRKRRPQHRTLERFDAHTLAARKQSAQARKEKSTEHDENIKNAVQEVQATLKTIGVEAKKQKLDATAILQKITNESRNLNRKLDEQKNENHQKYNEEIRKIDDAQEATILGMQGTYKLWAVIIPPIPPLLVAAFVFFNRRSKEREGVSKKRLR
ncbi:MAG: Gldg family protein [Planctomycetota bacterium]